MVNVITAIIINKPIAGVSAYAVNPDHAPEWYQNIKTVEWKTPKPLEVGSLVAFTAKFLGKRLAYVYEIAEWIPGEKLVMRTADGPFPMETTYTWTAIDNNTTKMTLQNRGKPTGFSKLFGPFMETMMRRANKKDLKKIKQILEAPE